MKTKLMALLVSALALLGAFLLLNPSSSQERTRELAGSVTSGITIAYQGKSGTDAPTRSKAPTGKQLRKIKRANSAVAKQLREFERKLASPAAKRERAESRTKFRDLSPNRALAAVENHQDEFIERPTAMGPRLRKGERITGFRTANTASVKLADGSMALAESNGVPLAAPVDGPGGKGRLEAVDLSLGEKAGSWVPRRPAVPITLPRGGAQNATVAGDVTVGLPNDRGQGELVGGTRAFYAEQLKDTDIVLEPANRGLKVSWVLRSPAAPSVLPLDVGVANADSPEFRITKNQTVDVLVNGKQVSSVEPLTAWDAQGRTVEAKYRVDGDELVVDVPHASKDLAYPIVVDPLVWEGYASAVMDNSGFYGPNDPAPVRAGGPWQRHTMQENAFWFSNPWDGHISLSLNNTQNQGSGWWTYSPIRQSKAFRAEFHNVRRDVGNASLVVGLYSGAQWNETAQSHYYIHNVSTNGIWVNGPFFLANGIGPTEVTSCASSDCVQGGNYDNFLAFQLNSSGGRNAPFTAALDGAVIWHRETDAPVITGLTVEGVTPGQWTNRGQLSAVLSADDYGIGFCSDGNLTDPALRKEPFVVEREGTGGVGSYGFTYVGGCTGSTHYMPAPGHVDLRWNEGEFGYPRLPEGESNMRFVAQDMFGNRATQNQTVRVDRTAPPTVTVGGRLSDYLTEPGPGGVVPDGIRTLFGPADITVNANDASGAPEVSGVNRVEFWVSPLGAGGWGAWNNFRTLTGCTEGGAAVANKVCGRVAASEVPATIAGTYQIIVRAWDNAGNWRDVHRYFSRGGGEISTVVEGQSTARWVPLGARRTTGNPTQATFKWRAAPAATPTVLSAWTEIPADALQRESDSVRLANGTVTMVQEPGAAAGTMATDRYVLDLDKLIEKAGIGDLGNGKILLRAEFNGTGEPAERVSEDVSIRLDRGGRDTDDEEEELGPGAVDLLTGNLSLGESDASIAGLQTDLSLERKYNSRYSAEKSRLGPGWSIDLTADAASDWAKVVDLSDPARLGHRTRRFDDNLQDWVEEPVAGAVFEDEYPAVEVQDGSGAGFVFERRDSDGAYLPEAGFEALSLRRVSGAGDATDRFELTDQDSGITTTFGKRLDRPELPTKPGEPAHGSFGITGVTVPGVDGSPTWVYGDAGGVSATPSLPVAAIASTTPTLNCGATPMPAGCQRMDLTYVKHAQTNEPRLTGVWVTMWDPATGQMLKRELTRYTYSADAAGRLIRVDDVRAKSFVKYVYNAAGLLESVTEGAFADDSVTELNEPAHRLTYAQFPEDKAPGRLRSASRDAFPGTATWTLAYGDREFGGANPWDLSKATIAKWGQTVTPFRATAIFSPQDPVGTDQASLRKADISYLDALGREVNSALPGGRISVNDFNKYGNVTRKLSAAAREKALLNTADTTGEANRLATLFEYETLQRESNGVPRTMQRLSRELEPIRILKLASGAQVSGRTVTSTVYDEGVAAADIGLYNLPTTTRRGVLTGAMSNGSGGSVSDIRETKHEYQWSTRQVTKTVADSGTGKLNLTQVIVRDTAGREVEKRQPSANASAAATTTKTTYYAQGAPGVCGTNPAWNGLVCQVGPGAQPAASPRPALAVKTFSYDYWLRPVKITETVGSQTRTTETTYDGRDRPLIEKVTGGVGTAVLTKHVYDPLGNELETQKLAADGVTILSRVKRTPDALGRMTSYEDAYGNKRTTTYDLLGRVAGETDLMGATTIASRTYGYDQTTGDATSIAETGVGGIGTITASYDADGRAIAVRYPLPGATAGEVTKSIEYASDGTVSRQAYTKTVGCSTACLWYENRVVRSAHDQIVDDISTGLTRQYSYDGVGRLTGATDKQGSQACVTRSYTYDANSNRTARRSATASTATAPCIAPGGTSGTSITAAFDDADRAKTYTDASGTGDVIYDAFGRITKLPWHASNGTGVDSTYYANDLVHQVWTGPWRETNELEPLRRLHARTLDNGGVTQHTDRYAYGDDTDEPSFIVTGTSWRRFAEDMTGDMVAQTNQAGAKVLQIANIRGDTVAEAPLASSTTGLSKTIALDEFGVRLGTVDSFADRSYGFLGAKQRESIHNGAVVAMGVRSYSPWTGRFLQEDPISGGSSNPYDYSYQDPVNVQDLDGRCPICAGLVVRAGVGFAIKLASRKAVKRVVRGQAARKGTSYRSMTKSNFRTNLVRRYGLNPGRKYHAHHMFPKKFAKDFQDRFGINVHDPANGVFWRAGPHLKNVKAYQKSWEKWLDDNPGSFGPGGTPLDTRAAYRHANYLAKKYKLGWKYKGPM